MRGGLDTKDIACLPAMTTSHVAQQCLAKNGKYCSRRWSACTQLTLQKEPSEELTRRACGCEGRAGMTIHGRRGRGQVGTAMQPVLCRCNDFLCLCSDALLRSRSVPCGNSAACKSASSYLPCHGPHISWVLCISACKQLTCQG